MALPGPTTQDKADLPGYVPRLLGAAFLIVILTSLIGGVLQNSAVGTGSISDILSGAAHGVTQLRASVLVDLVTTLGIVVMAALLYRVLSGRFVKSHRLSPWVQRRGRVDSVSSDSGRGRSVGPEPEVMTALDARWRRPPG